MIPPDVRAKMVREALEWWEKQPAAKERIAHLLGDGRALTEELVLTTYAGRIFTPLMAGAWADRPGVKRVGVLTDRLLMAIGAMEQQDRDVLEYELDRIGRSVMGALNDPPPYDPRDLLPVDLPWVIVFREFLCGLKLILRKPKSPGRPREDAREHFARRIAEVFIAAGMKPAKSNHGVYADVLRALFPTVGLTAPDDMYRLTARAASGFSYNKRTDVRRVDVAAKKRG